MRRFTMTKIVDETARKLGVGKKAALIILAMDDFLDDLKSSAK